MLIQLINGIGACQTPCLKLPLLLRTLRTSDPMVSTTQTEVGDGSRIWLEI
jgi:hypothetical protein